MARAGQCGRQRTGGVAVPAFKAGDIWLAQLDPTVGGEIQKTRPYVVASPDDMNAHLRTVIVAPMTTGSRPARFRIPLTFQGKQGLILLDPFCTLDGVRLVKRLWRPARTNAGRHAADLADYVLALRRRRFALP